MVDLSKYFSSDDIKRIEEKYDMPNSNEFREQIAAIHNRQYDRQITIDHAIELTLSLVASREKEIRLEELEKLPHDVHSRHATRVTLCVPYRQVKARITDIKARGDTPE